MPKKVYTKPTNIKRREEDTPCRIIRRAREEIERRLLERRRRGTAIIWATEE